MSYLLTLIDSQKVIERAMTDLELLNALIKERHQFYKSNRQHGLTLTSWLVKGSLVLDEYGGIGFFTPSKEFKDFDFPDVIETKKILINVVGSTLSGGSRSSLPEEGSICPYCGKKVTLQDVYTQNFHVEGTTNNPLAYHSGSCHTFHCYFEDSFAVTRAIILAAKRVFEEIEKICVQEGIHEQDELVRISFIAVNHKIEIVVMPFDSGVTITCDNDTAQHVIYSGYCSPSTVEEKLKEWKNTL